MTLIWPRAEIISCENKHSSMADCRLQSVNVRNYRERLIGSERRNYLPRNSILIDESLPSTVNLNRISCAHWPGVTTRVQSELQKHSAYFGLYFNRVGCTWPFFFFFFEDCWMSWDWCPALCMLNGLVLYIFIPVGSIYFANGLDLGLTFADLGLSSMPNQ